MPRDGSNVYSADWTNAAPNTTIESSKQNAMIADFVADANAARPITAGGTGATTAAGARDALGLEIGNDIPSFAAVSGLLYGLTLSNNVTDATNDIDIATGSAIDSTNTHVMTLGSSITKRLDAAWAVGTGNGGLDTGSIANTTYHVYLIKRPDTGVVDALFSANATTPTMPANYTLYRRVGSIIRKSAAILAFVQVGDEFIWRSLQPDHVAASLGTTPTAFALTVPAGLTVGVRAIFSTYFFKSATAVSGVIYSPSTSNPSPSVSLNNLGSVSGAIDSVATASHTVRTSSAGEVNAVASAASCTLYITTFGYLDTRGRM